MGLNIIYKNIWFYRIIMSLLYRGLYTQRFANIINVIGPSDRSILEVCFGDIHIANYCAHTGRKWKGLDINPSFITFAKNKGFDAEYGDISTLDRLPAADECIMAGSLYHFHHATMRVLSLMLASAPVVIISEPVKNITSMMGIIGTIGAFASSAGKGAEHFRYTTQTLTDMFDSASKQLSFSYEIISEGRDLLVRITRN
jgi:hypothetical protein